MMRWLVVLSVFVASAAFGVLSWFTMDWGWYIVTGVLFGLGCIGVFDMLQKTHSVLRNYPIAGHMRFLLEEIRPEIMQYFVEKNTEGMPFNRVKRDLVYARAHGFHGEKPFGTERDVNETGFEFFAHSLRARPKPDGPQPRVTLGGPQCTKPYDIALLNVSAMSFGSLSANAIEALNAGAALGGFAHDTGEGSISKHHMKHGGDLIMEVASGYFGCRNDDGTFNPDAFAERATMDQVKAINIKLSQGAKPGLGGLLPGDKVNKEVAEARGVPIGTTVVSPPTHPAFKTPRQLMDFIQQLRDLSGGKPVGFKLCVGSKREFLALVKAMLEKEIVPDFIIVDGSEGGTGAGPVEFEDHVGMPLTEGLMFVHNALVGAGLREQVKIGASGKVASGSDIVKRICQGADFTLAARAMMFAVGCIQAQKCHTNHCPVGVATQDPARTRSLVVSDKKIRVQQFQEKTVNSAWQIVSSMGLKSFDDLSPRKLFRRTSPNETMTYYDLYEWLLPGELLTNPRDTWRRDWEAANPKSFDPIEWP